MIDFVLVEKLMLLEIKNLLDLQKYAFKLCYQCIILLSVQYSELLTPPNFFC
jgi:hypothetical protein